MVCSLWLVVYSLRLFKRLIVYGLWLLRLLDCTSTSLSIDYSKRRWGGVRCELVVEDFLDFGVVVVDDASDFVVGEGAVDAEVLEGAGGDFE